MGAPATDRVANLWSLLESRAGETMIYARGETWDGAQLRDAARAFADELGAAGVKPGSVVAVLVDQTPESFAALLGAWWHRAIVVVVGRRQKAELPRLAQIASAEWIVDPREESVEAHQPAAANPLIESFRERGHAGLVVFTSGSTGEPKGILHDLESVLRKFDDRSRRGFRTLLLMPLHHMGGINTLLGAVHRPGGMAVFADGRRIDSVTRAIEAAKVDLLPATPSFLNLLLASGPHQEDLSSVSFITYGAEVMPEGLLRRVRKAFPNARLKQTYALTEIGALPRMKSRPDGSLWLRLTDPEFDLRVHEGRLHLRSPYAMVGYLNAPYPFDEDGWLDTGDAVEVDGEWIRVLGRASDLINVGGEKVFPAEVEEVLQRADNVVDAACHGEPDPLLGRRVIATVQLEAPEDPVELRKRLRKFCLGSLDRYKVPMRFVVAEGSLVSDRLKKRRGT